MIEIGKAYIKFGIENPDLMKIMFFSDLKKKIDLSKIANVNNNGYSILEESIKKCISTGETYIKDVQTLCLLSWSFVHGLTALMMENVIVFNDAIDVIIDKMVSLHVDGYFK